MSNLNKNPILIFGSTGSIGMASTNILRKNKHELLLSNSNDNEDIKNLSQKVSSPYFSFDLLNEEFTHQMLSDKISNHTNCLSGLIISIAKPFPNKFIHNTDDFVLKEQLNIHILTFHKIIKSCLPFLEACNTQCIPRITYISTEYLLGSPPIKIAPYLAAKSAATTYAKVLAKELITKGIKVFILSPGMVRSKLTSNLPEIYLQQVEEKMPNKRLTSPEEISLTINAIYQGYLDASFGNEIQVSNAERR